VALLGFSLAALKEPDHLFGTPSGSPRSDKMIGGAVRSRAGGLNESFQGWLGSRMVQPRCTHRGRAVCAARRGVVSMAKALRERSCRAPAPQCVFGLPTEGVASRQFTAPKA
jgi:hypothetical protein